MECVPCKRAKQNVLRIVFGALRTQGPAEQNQLSSSLMLPFAEVVDNIHQQQIVERKCSVFSFPNGTSACVSPAGFR